MNKPKLIDVEMNIRANQVSRKRNGNLIARWGFFYRHGQSADIKVGQILQAYPNAIIIDSGEQWKSFRSGASLARSSHFWVEFTLPSEPKTIDGFDAVEDLREDGPSCVCDSGEECPLHPCPHRSLAQYE